MNQNNLPKTELQVSSSCDPAAEPPGAGGGQVRSACPPPDSGVASLLYPNSNISDNTLSDTFNKLTPYHQKAAFVLSENCRKFISETGIDRTGFLTLTFPDNVKSHKEASRRFDNLNRRFLRRFFATWMLVRERQRRGAWHYHILVDCGSDIRTGVNFDEIALGNYASASDSLRGFWRLLRKILPRYGFGRSELLPIKESSMAIAAYVGKYISKHIEIGRKEEDKGVRLVSYSAQFVRSSAKLAWNSDGSKEWRRKLQKFATLTKCYNLDALCMTFGRFWAKNLADYIDAVDTLTPPEIARIRNVYEKNNLTPYVGCSCSSDPPFIHNQQDSLPF